MTKLVDIVLADRGWVLERCGTELEARLPYVVLRDSATESIPVAYYVNYSAWRGRKGKKEAAFFTHLEPSPNARETFFKVANSMDACVCMSNVYANMLLEQGNRDVTTIVPGVDLGRYQPKARIGIVGRTYNTGRKGEWLLKELHDIEGVEFVSTHSGWCADGQSIADSDMPAFFRSLDYLLVTAAYEGGPMPVVEALASGLEIIAPPVGFIPDYPHIPYDPFDAESLKKVVSRLVKEKLSDKQLRRNSVLSLSWDSWAEQHDKLFQKMLKETGDSVVIYHSRSTEVQLVLHGAEHVLSGGPSVRVRSLQQGLRQMGWKASLNSSTEYKTQSRVHIFNIWEPDSCHKEMRGAVEHGMNAVFSPILLDLRTMYKYLPLRDLFEAASLKGETHIAQFLEELSGGQIDCTPEMKKNIDAVLDRYVSLGRACIEQACHVLFLSEAEKNLAKDWFNTDQSGTVVYNGVNLIRPADAMAFARQFDVFDYVLCVGRVEPRKNQLLLVEALRGTGIPTVLVGDVADQRYADLIAARGGEMVRMVGRLPPHSSLLHSALRGARVFSLPSWTEGGPLAALEAAMSGASLVLGSGGAEVEYFGEFARYCDAGNLGSIRAAIMEAYETHRNQADICRQITHFEEHFSTEKMVQQTVAAYRQNDQPLTLSQPRQCQPEKPAPRCGHVDEISGPFLSGWVARLPDDACRPEVAVLVDGKTASVGRAQLFRQDLSDAGSEDCHCGFHIELPEYVFDGQEHHVDVKVVADGEYVILSQLVRLNPTDLEHTHYRRKFQGFVDLVALDSVQGWVRNVFDDCEKPLVELLIDGCPVAEELAALPREDLLSKRIGDGHHGFKLPTPPHISLGGGVHDVRVRVKGTTFELRRSPGKTDFGELGRRLVQNTLSDRSILLDGDLIILPRVAIGTPVDFARGKSGSRLLMEGWAASELWGTWSIARKAAMAFSPAANGGKMRAMLKAIGFCPNRQRDVHVDVYINKKMVDTWILSGDVSDRHIEIDVDRVGSSLILEFSILNPTSPSDWGLSNDRRLLGIGLQSLVIEAA